MKTNPISSSSLKPDELKLVYAISRVVAEKLDIDKALSEIFRLVRPVFIFDKAVLYLENHENYPLGSYLNPECGKIIQKGDSIFKIKGSMKLSIFRNGNYLCGDYNSYYKPKRCSCD